MLLLHPLPTCAVAGPDLCTFCPDLCTLHPDLCTLRLWCYLSINQRKYSTFTHGGGHWLQLARGVFPSAIGANTSCTGGGDTHCNLRWWSFSFHPLAHILHWRSSNLHCVVVVCGGGSYMWKWRWWFIYIYILYISVCIYIYIYNLHCIYIYIYYIFIS